MNRMILVGACAAAIATFSVAGVSAQTSGPAGQQTVKSGALMNSNARMMRKHHMMRHGMRKDPSKRGGQPKSGTQG